jgi:uncharacterized membrane protein
MNREKNLQILITIYQEVNSHLRATDEKRDRLLSIYISIVLAVSSGTILLKVNSLQLSVDSLVLALTLFFILFVFGEDVFIALVGLRKWHAEYVNCLLLLHSMMSKEAYDDIRANQVSSKHRYAYIRAIHSSREFILVEVTVVGIYLMAANILAPQVGNAVYIPAMTLALVTLVVDNIIANRFLRKAEYQFWTDPKTSWVFSELSFAKVKRPVKQSQN